MILRPGVRCNEIADELNEMLLEKGMLHLRTFGYGHSFGVISHYYGREPGELIQILLKLKLCCALK